MVFMISWVSAMKAGESRRGFVSSGMADRIPGLEQCGPLVRLHQSGGRLVRASTMGSAGSRGRRLCSEHGFVREQRVPIPVTQRERYMIYTPL